MSRILALSALLLVLLPAAPASAQGVPTLTIGSGASVNLIPPGEIVADGKRISLTVLVTDETGALANGVRFRGSGASAGRLDQDCPQIGEGLYTCGYVTPDRAVGAADIRLRARLASNSQIEASFPVQITPQARARLTFNATPAEIVLTQDPSSSLVFTVVDAAGAPMAGLQLRAASNVGSVQAVSESGAGTYSAVYVPPTTPFPQVAVLSVWDAENPDQVFGFFRIPLIGKVDYPVDARAAGVTLVFKVGDTTFPPVVSDATGKARVPITVPPGVSNASVELIQPNGARSTQTIDLQVPPFNQLAIGGVPDFVPGDGVHQTRIRVFAVDGRGRPANGAPIQVQTSQGSVSAVQAVGNGLYEAVLTSPSLSASGSTTIVATLAGAEAASSDSVELGLEPGGPSALSLSANQSTVTATLLGATGQPMAGSNVQFRTAAGPIRNAQAAGPGAFSAKVPGGANVRSRVQAIAAIPGNRQQVAQIVALPMSDWTMTGQKVPVTVLSLDRYGNPVAGASLACATIGGGGSVPGTVTTDANGIGSILYQAGPLAGLATIRLSAGAVSYVAPIWQSSQPLRSFEFPVSGGQRQGSVMARWKKLSAMVDVGQAPVAAPAPAPVAETSGQVWGSGGSTAAPAPAPTTSGSTIANIQVSSIPASVPETGGTVSILVKVTDAAGILVPGESVILLTDGGSLTGKTDNGDGTLSATLTIPPNLGRSEVQVTATRPAGDLAGFAKIGVGAAPKMARKARKPRKAAAAGASTSGNTPRTAQLWIGWAPGGYKYDSNPCVPGSEPCEAPADGLLDDYDFLKVQVRGAEGTGMAPAVGSFTVGGEWFPFQDYVGPRVTFTRLAYSTDFEASSGEGDSHCASHFCDGMSFVNIDAQGRFALLRNKGPLDIMARVGYQFQDVVIFRRLYNPATETREPRFETIGLHGIRVGAGLRYTINPTATLALVPHVDYNLSLGIQATLGEASFGVPGVTNHNLALGLTLLPWKGLLIDAGYDLTTRSMGLAFANEEGVEQRGTLSEQSHTFRLSAGWAF